MFSGRGVQLDHLCTLTLQHVELPLPGAYLGRPGVGHEGDEAAEQGLARGADQGGKGPRPGVVGERSRHVARLALATAS